MQFDWVFYVGHYKDLQNAGLDTEAKAREHWNLHGQNEGRMCNPEQVPFNWHYYLALNDDLELAGITTRAAAEEHWALYGKREGRIFRPTLRILCVVAVHLDSYLKIDTFINNIPYLNEIAKVVVVASELPDLGYRTDELNAILDTVDHYEIPNDPVLVCYSKYKHYLETNDWSLYDRIILTNDSYYICRPLTTFRYYCLLDKDCIAFSASNERTYHLTDYLRCYNQEGIKIMLDLFKSEPKTVNDAIQAFEVESTFEHFIVFHHAIPGFMNNIMFNDARLSWAVLNQGLELIKLKALTRVIYTEIPTDFDPVIYKYQNADLRHLTDDEARDHFINHGMSDGRLYKPQKAVLYPGLKSLFEMIRVDIPKSLLPQTELPSTELPSTVLPSEDIVP
jgi:hypothetical protein